MTNSTHLRQWLRMLSYELMRGVESRQSARRADGRALNAIEVSPGLYLARDKRFYATTPARPFVALAISDDEALARVSLSEIKREIAAKWQARKRRVMDRRAHRAAHRAS